MASSSEIDLTWDMSDFNTNVARFSSRFMTSVMVVCDTAAIKMENYAKENAIWTDRTGNARQRLQGRSNMATLGEIEIVVSHHMSYGYWLELAHGREYAILEESIEENVEELFRALKRLIGRL